MHLRCLWTCTVVYSSKKHAHKHKFMNRQILKKRAKAKTPYNNISPILTINVFKIFCSEKGSKIESALLRFAADKYRCPKWKKSRSSSEWKRMCFYLLPVVQERLRKAWRCTSDYRYNGWWLIEMAGLNCIMSARWRVHDHGKETRQGLIFHSKELIASSHIIAVEQQRQQQKKALHSHHCYLKLTEGSRGGRVCMYTHLMTY